jgi:hypothetical protein
MTTFAEQPPNQNYTISPITNTPEEMQHDLFIIPEEKVCPVDGGRLVRVGSLGDNIRCAQCGYQGRFV